MKKAIGFTGVIVTYTVLVALFLLGYGHLDNRWYRIITVDGNSMSPTLWFGDYVVVTPPTEVIPAGTIITMSVGKGVTTHRLIAEYKKGERPQTKGDGNSAIDDFSGKTLRIIGIARMRLPGFGYPVLFFYYLLSKI